MIVIEVDYAGVYHLMWAKDKYNFTLIGYALLYNKGEVLRTPTHNLSYIYIWEGWL